MPNDLVELVIPTYDRPAALRLAVASALEHTDFRVTVLDDNSPEPAAETLGVEAGCEAEGGRLRVIRNPCNLGASLNILRSLEISRAPYTWAFSDDQLVRPGTGEEIVAAIRADDDASVLFWNPGLGQDERFAIDDLSRYIDLIERDRPTFGFSDLHFSRIVKTAVGRRYLRYDARFSHAQPMLGIQIAALADGERLQLRGGEIAAIQELSDSGWSPGYLQRFKLDPAYLIPDPALRDRYRAVVSSHFPWREALIDIPSGSAGSVDEAFALDAARLVAGARLPWRLRAEARIALFLRSSRLGGLVRRGLPAKNGAAEAKQFGKATW